MKPTIITLLLCFLAFGAAAQQPRLGLEAGISGNLGLQGHVTGYSFRSAATGIRAGLRIGVPVELYLSQKTRLHTGMYYAMKGIMHHKVYSTGSVRYSTLEIPLALTWGKVDEHRNSFFAGVGIYAGAAITAGETVTDNSGNTEKHTMKFGRDLRRPDAGILLHAGYQLRSGWNIRLLAQRSVINMGMGADKPVLFDTHMVSSLYSRLYTAVTVSYWFPVSPRY